MSVTPECPWDVSMTAINALPCPKHGGPMGECPVHPFYAPGYQYDVAVAGATNALMQKVNAFAALLAVAKAAEADRSIAQKMQSAIMLRTEVALDALTAAHPDWRTWTP